VSRKIFNVPNQLTMARLVLSIAVFVLIPMGNYIASMVLFLIAALTDWADGYWARKFGQVTQLGRILDPFVDKIVICGTFVFLVAEDGSGIKAWIAVVVVGREMLVTALRSFLEQQGCDFSASASGKLKMVLQCAAVVASLWTLSYVEGGPCDWTITVRDGLVIGVVVMTIYSGVEYIVSAIRLMRD